MDSRFTGSRAAKKWYYEEKKEVGGKMSPSNSEQEKLSIKKIPPLNPNPDMKPTIVNLDELSARLRAKRKELFSRIHEY